MRYRAGASVRDIASKRLAGFRSRLRARRRIFIAEESENGKPLHLFEPTMHPAILSLHR